MQKNLTILFAFAIFVLVLGWSITPAQAHCKDPDHFDCNKGDDDGRTPTIVETDVQWGSNIDESDPRPCVASQVANNGDSGFYVCQLDPPGSNEVRYNLEDGVPTARTRDAFGFLCTVFNGIDLTLDRVYGYRWSENCGDGTCTIVINNWFSNENAQVTGATKGEADFIRLRAFAEARGPFMDANPFVNPLMLEVDEINITFYAAGSNKKIAVCAYRPDLHNLTVGNVTFESVPDPMP